VEVTGATVTMERYAMALLSAPQRLASLGGTDEGVRPYTSAGCRLRCAELN
jgi:hypothetical protein